MANGKRGTRPRTPHDVTAVRVIASRKRPRRSVLVALTAVAVLIAGLEAPAAAAKQSELDKARSRYREVQGQLNKLAEQYAKQEERYDNLVLKIAATKKSISKTSAQANQ